MKFEPSNGRRRTEAVNKIQKVILSMEITIMMYQ